MIKFQDQNNKQSLKRIHKSFHLQMTNKYYIPKCFVKWLNKKTKCFET